MNKETANLMSLGECDPELEKKIIQDIERIVAIYIAREAVDIGARIISEHAVALERMALRALKNHLNNSPTI